RQRGAVGLRRIGGREHERLGLLPALAQLADALDRAAERELRAAEPLDEVAAATEPEGLERPKLGVDGPVAAGDALGAHAVARDDAVPLEQQLGERTPIGRTREEAVGARPAAGRRGRSPRAATGEAARPPLLPRPPQATGGAEGRPG